MVFPMIDSVKTGANIKAKSKAKGYSAENLKDVLGMGDKSNVYKWFRGESLPGLDNMIALSVLLGVTVNDLVVTV